MIFTELMSWSMWYWKLLLVIVLLTIYCWAVWNNKFFKKRNIPYLKPSFLVGNRQLSLKNRPGREQFPDFILRTYMELKDYPFGGIFNLTQPILMLRDPELIKTITVKDFDHFTDHHSFFDEDVEPIWGKSLLNLTGKRWKDMRSALTPAFTASKMKTIFVLVNDCCQQLVNFLEQCHQQPPEQSCEIQKDGEILILELNDLYTRYSNDVIATTAFGIGVDSLKQPTNEFYMMGQRVFKIGNALNRNRSRGLSVLPKIMQVFRMRAIPKKVTEFFLSTIHEAISTREQKGIVRPDMIQLLLQAKKGDLKGDKQEEKSSDSEETIKEFELDNDDIAAQALVFFLTGFDTTSTSLCFASHQLAIHPEIQTRLQEEIDKTLEENGGKFTYEALNSMKYLDMVLSETLRMFPPAVVSDRLCVKPYTLEVHDLSLELQPGDSLFIPIYALHHDPQYFPDPERFDPERFSDENKQNINPLAYLPFGVGPRSCIGNRFALMETKLALVHLLSRFNLKVIAKSPMPIKIIERGFNMSIEEGFWFGLELRSSS